MNVEEQAIAAVLKKYEDALNASSTDAVMPLYAEDGVLMPTALDVQRWRAAVRNAYKAVFAAIQLTVRFEIVEVRQIAADWAFARTNSAGTVQIHANGQRGAEATRNFSSSRR